MRIYARLPQVYRNGSKWHLLTLLHYILTYHLSSRVQHSTAYFLHQECLSLKFLCIKAQELSGHAFATPVSQNVESLTHRDDCFHAYSVTLYYDVAYLE